ncbi:MAG: sigma-54 interaction domain-containing protein [Desulforhopalus sp.]
MAIAISLSSFFELWTFKADTLIEYLPLFKMTLVVQCILWACFAWFVYLFTESVKIWPPVLISILYTLALFINIFSPASILYREIVEFVPYAMASGEAVWLASGPANILRFIADISWLILLVYTAIAIIKFGKRGNGSKAIFFGTTIFLCLGLGYLHGTLIDIGVAEPPYLGSFLFLPLTLLMSFSLAGDVVRASLLSQEIKTAELRWRNLLENVHLLVLGVDKDKRISYVNPFFLKSTGYEEHDVLNHPIVNILPEKERQAIEVRIDEILLGKSTILAERHLPILTRSGQQKEIAWSNVLTSDPDNQPGGILSVGKDITNQLHAEAARDQAVLELESLKEKLEKENFSLKEIILADHGFDEIIGKSNELLYVLSKVQHVATTDSTVLILGETGTGKELIARAIYLESHRASRPFIRVNCAAIPSELVESELFGHEPGSFTNAINLRRGKFELADGGTIFLDEIGEMPLDIQAKLLSVLQEGELERVGGSKTIPVDVRVISATNRDINVEVAEGRFRADLFYRLNVYPITIPPLRNRIEDIPLLALHFVAMFSKKFGKRIEEIPTSLMDLLTAYNWPGNIRELQNMLERAVISSGGSTLHFPEELTHIMKSKDNYEPVETELLPLAEIERQHILRTLQKTNGQIGGLKGAARILKMNPSTLRSRIKKFGLKKS